VEIINNITTMQAFSNRARAEGKTIALVPTMGYLHQGHVSLLQEGRTRGDYLVMSIFVNPTQFGVGEDFEDYPRDMERDHVLAQEAGVDLILLACSTFNSAVEVARPLIDIPMLQIDRPMMDRAVQHGKKIGLLATVPSTVIPSERLLNLAAKEAGREIEVTTSLCSEAFEEIKRGNIEKHNDLLLKEIKKLSGKVDAITMAQVSMSALEPYLENTTVPVYNSGRTGFTRVREILEEL